MASNPMEQFAVKSLIDIKLGDIDLSFTNSSLFMVIAFISIVAFLLLGMKRRELVPGRLQSAVELSYEFVAGMIRDNIGVNGKKFFPLIFSLFMFILACNLFGMIPFFFTVTSQLIVTFIFGFLVFFAVVLYGFYKHGFKFLTLFAPSGVNIVMLPILYILELFSFLVRPITLAVRLAANMIIGHMLLKIVAGFIGAAFKSLTAAGIFVGFISLSFTIAFVAFELFVAVLQAYVFALLACVYLKDAVELH